MGLLLTDAKLAKVPLTVLSFVRSSPKQAFISCYPRASGLSFTRTRPLFAFWISSKLRTGGSLGVASWLWSILTMVHYHSWETLLGET